MSLQVTVVRAQNLPRTDEGGRGKIDPYFKVIFAGQAFETSRRQNDLNPNYNETFSFADPPSWDQLQIELYDDDGVTAKFIANTQPINTDDLPPSSTVSFPLISTTPGILISNASVELQLVKVASQRGAKTRGFGGGGGQQVIVTQPQTVVVQPQPQVVVSQRQLPQQPQTVVISGGGGGGGRYGNQPQTVVVPQQPQTVVVSGGGGGRGGQQTVVVPQQPQTVVVSGGGGGGGGGRRGNQPQTVVVPQQTVVVSGGGGGGRGGQQTVVVPQQPQTVVVSGGGGVQQRGNVVVVNQPGGRGGRR